MTTRLQLNAAVSCIKEPSYATQFNIYTHKKPQKPQFISSVVAHATDTHMHNGTYSEHDDKVKLCLRQAEGGGK